jgi:hypothetical protein
VSIIINPAEGLDNIWSWKQHIAVHGVAGGGDDLATNRKHTIVSPCTGTVTSAGGPYGDIVIRIEGDSKGRSIRIAENAKVLVKVGQKVNIFDPIAQDCLYRGGQYKATHFNGQARNGTRIPFLPMVNHTIASARKALAPDPLKATERLVLPNSNANLRSAPVVKSANKTGQAKAGTQVQALGYVFGAIVDSNPLWYVTKVDSDRYPIEFLWSGGTTDIKPHDLKQLQERPAPEPEQEPVPEPLPDVELEPTPLPESLSVPEKPTKEKPMATVTPPKNAATAPTVPADIILPRKVRGHVLLWSWIVGSAIGATNVGWIYAVQQGDAEYPLWLGIATAVFGFVSSQANAIARANLNPPTS